MELTITIAILLILISILLGLIRFIKGPEITDRILSLDTITIMVTSILVILALYFNREVYIDVALIFGVIGFIGVVILGKFLGKGV